MPYSTNIIRLLEKLEPSMREVLIALLEEIERQREETVTKKEFKEFAQRTEENFQRVWEAIKELTKAQKRTEQSINELAEAQKETQKEVSRLDKALHELAEAQKETQKEVSRLDKALHELAEAQKETQKEVSRLDRALHELAEAQKETQKEVSRLDRALHELAEAQKETQKEVSRLDKALHELAEAQKETEEEIKKLSIGLRRTRQEIGGLSKSVAYALENEAFVRLPMFLKKHLNIEIKERFIRTEINNQEINLFARGTKDGKNIILVGESVLKLDDVSKLRAVEDKVDAVSEEIEEEVIPIIITHFAKKKVLEKAEKRGIIIVQSFQW